MKRNYHFGSDLKVGQEAEQKFLEWLAKDNVKAWQIAGNFKFYDIIDQQGVTYEIKQDRWMERTGNILREIWYKKDEKPGWWMYTKADILVIYYNDNDFVTVPMKNLRAPSIPWKTKEITQADGSITVNELAPVNTIPGLTRGSNNA